MNRNVVRLAAPTAMLGIALCQSVNVQSSTVGPTIQVLVDGNPVEVPLEFARDGKMMIWDFNGQLEIGGPDGAVLTSLNMSADPDPFMGYAIGVVDIGAPSIFGFVFGTPIVPTAPPGVVNSSFSASLTDGGSGAISITPMAPGVGVDGDGIAEIHVASDGFPLFNDGLDLGPAAAFGAGASVHGPFNETGPLLGPGASTWMQINVTFGGSGGSDFYALSGSLEKYETATVPEAGSTLLLSLIGFAGCALARRLRTVIK